MTDSMTITSLANPHIKELRLNKASKERFLVEGYHLVEMAFLSSCLDEVLFASSLPAYLGNDDIKKIKVSKQIIDRLSYAKSPEGIIGVCHKNEDREYGDKAIVLDRIQDPGNLGAILRSAVAFGFKDVYFLPNTCSPFNPKALLSSQGAIFPLRLFYPQEEEKMLLSLKEKGYRVYATALRDSLPLETYKFEKACKTAFIFGNEGKGVSEYLLQNADARLRITIDGIESLNVAVAAGILLHAVTRV